MVRCLIPASTMTYERLDLGTAQPVPRDGTVSSVPLSQQSLAWVRFIFGLFLVGALMRIFLTDVIVNLAWPYTHEGGIFPGKIHPGSYLMAMAAGLLYLSPGYRFAAHDLPVLRAIIVFAFGSVIAAAFPMMQGRNGPAGYVIDTYLVACLACGFLLAMPPRWRQIFGLTVIGVLAFNSLLSVGEFATGRYIIPVEAAEFRPTGFLGAALNVGVINLTACIFLVSLPVGAKWKTTLIAILMAGLLISGSRTAMLMAIVFLPIAVLLTARLGNTGPSVGVKAIAMIVFATTVLPLLLLAFSELGFLDRFKGGYVDDSAQTRIDIYRVFEFVGWRDIVLGTDILRIRQIATDMLGIKLIESAVVFFVFDFGAVCALFFVSLFVWLLWRIGRNSHPVIGIGLAVFLFLALTNNTLSTKVPSTFAALALAISLSAFHSGVRRI